MSCKLCNQQGHEAWKCFSNLNSFIEYREYFTNLGVQYSIASETALHLNSKYVPPKSPFNLIKESLYLDAWKVLVSCMCLNRTTGRQSRPAVLKLFFKYPTPHSLLQGNMEDIMEIVKPLGMWKKRSATLLKMTSEYLEKAWTYPFEIFGIGKYATDAYLIFCCGKWNEVLPEDHMLVHYVNFLQKHSSMKNEREEMAAPQEREENIIKLEREQPSIKQERGEEETGNLQENQTSIRMDLKCPKCENGSNQFCVKRKPKTGQKSKFFAQKKTVPEFVEELRSPFFVGEGSCNKQKLVV